MQTNNELSGLDDPSVSAERLKINCCEKFILLVFVEQVLVLRELATSTPTFFFQQVQNFFDYIFNAVRDSKVRFGKKNLFDGMNRWHCIVLTRDVCEH